jgi:riboflavin synthase
VVTVFTGLVQGRGEVTAVERDGDGARLSVATADLAPELSEGDSVAVNGVCLTATAVSGRGFSADVVEETLRRTSLGPLAAGREVNLELPLRPSDRLGGHVVQGHVDGVGTVESLRDEGFSRVLRVTGASELLRYVVEKGSIAIDGVSLTVAAVDAEALEVALIPETLERTTLGALETGSPVNLEVDLFAKYVEKLMSPTVEAR